tara:strand:+ start:944 stop:1489 length:546 start_codon:yes stop_codon:yes gene_type:complete
MKDLDKCRNYYNISDAYDDALFALDLRNDASTRKELDIARDALDAYHDAHCSVGNVLVAYGDYNKKGGEINLKAKIKHSYYHNHTNRKNTTLDKINYINYYKYPDGSTQYEKDGIWSLIINDIDVLEGLNATYCHMWEDNSYEYKANGIWSLINKGKDVMKGIRSTFVNARLDEITIKWLK